MSNMDKNVVVEETPASKLGVGTTTPQGFRAQIERLAGETIVLAAVGPSGIGKTAIPKQVAESRGAPYVALHMPTMTPEDFHIPTIPKDTKEKVGEVKFYDRRIPRRFQELLDYVADVKSKNGGKVPPDKRPILAVEELNRAVDKAVTRGAFVLLGDRMVGDVQLDDSIQFVVTMNPTGGGMAVNEFERDPAMRRRLCLMYVAPQYSDFINYAAGPGNFHPEVVSYLRAHSSQFYDEMAAKSGKVFPCPATWEGVSRICKAYEAGGVKLFENAVRDAISGYIGTGVAETFIEFVRDRSVTITPDDILDGYTERSEVRKRMRALLNADGGRLDRVTDLVQGLSVRVFSSTSKKPATIAKPLAMFMLDLPEEIMLAFIQRLADEANKGGQDSRTWMQQLNQALNKEDGYTAAITKYHKAKDRAKEEAEKAGVDK